MFKKTSIYFILILFIIVIPYLTIAQDQNKQNGINYINEGKYRKAIEELEKVILENPRDAEALFYLGIAYRNLGSGQLKNALSGISQALRIRPNDPTWQYALAQTYDDMDKFGVSLTDTNKTTYELAVDAYKKAFQLKLDFLEAHLSLGELYLRKGKYELASEKFKDVIKIDPENESAYSYLIDCLCKLDRYDEAITNLNKWSNINANRIEPHNLKAKIYWYQGIYEEAKREYQKVIGLDPNNQLARARLDSIMIIIQNSKGINELLSKGETLFNALQYEQAIVQFEQIIKIDPNHSIANERLREARKRLSDYWFNRGLERVRNNNLDGAVENFNRALQYVQSPEQMNKIMQQWQVAQKALGEKAQMYKLRQMGERFILEKEYSLAKEYLNIFERESGTSDSRVKIALDTLEIAALYKIASSKEKAGDWISALTFYFEVFKNDSTYKDIKFRIAKVNGDLARKYKKWDDAEEYYLRAIQINATSANLKESPDNISVVEKLRVISLNQKNKQIKLLSKYIAFAFLFLFIGIAIGTYIYYFYQKNREKFLSLINNIKNFFTWKTIFAIIIALALILFIYYFGGKLYRIMILVNPTLRSLIYWVIFAILIVIILTMLPKYVLAGFEISSERVNFSMFPVNDGSNLIFKNPLNASNLSIKKVKFIRLQTKTIKDINSQLSYNGDIIIKPYDEGGDIDIQIYKERHNDLKIYKINFISEDEFEFQKKGNSLNIIFGTRKRVEELNSENQNENLLEIDSEFRLILTKCRIVLENDVEKTIIKRKEFTVCSSIKENQKIYFVSKEKSSQIEIEFIKNQLEYPLQLFENISGKEINFIERTSDTFEKRKISTIKKGRIFLPFRYISTEELTDGDHLMIQPKKFKELSLAIDDTGLLCNFYSKIHSLKFGTAHILETVNNQIPSIAEWLLNETKTFLTVLFFIGWLVVLMMQPYLESFFIRETSVNKEPFGISISYLIIILFIVISIGISFTLIFRNPRLFLSFYLRIKELFVTKKTSPYIVGNPVSENNFILDENRREICRKILRKINNNNFIIIGDRRLGKTSLLIYLQSRIEQLNEEQNSYFFVSVYIDLQEILKEPSKTVTLSEVEALFFNSLLEKFLDRLNANLKIKIDEYKYLRSDSEFTISNFISNFEEVIDQFKDLIKKTIIVTYLIDEFDLFNKKY